MKISELSAQESSYGEQFAYKMQQESGEGQCCSTEEAKLMP